MIDLKFNYPSLPEENVYLRDWMNSHPDLSPLLFFPPVHGLESTREAARKWLNVNSSISDVIIANSGNHALSCILDCLEGKVTGIITDPFTYPAFKHIVQKKKVPLHSAETDEEGLTVDGLDAVQKKTNANVLYLQPTIHNPMCTIMSLARRRAIAEFAVKKDLIIIEDDAYRFLHPEAPLSFLDLVPEITIRVESLSKPFNPLLKITFVALPKEYANDMANMVRLTSSGSSSLLMAFAEHVVHSGILDNLIRLKQKHAIQLKREVLPILQGIPFQTHPNSFHLWLTLPRDVTSTMLSAILGEKGILIPTGNDFETVDSGSGVNRIRVALAAERDLLKLKSALTELRKLVDAGHH